jgi:Protein of unknown function (DUF1018)
MSAIAAIHVAKKQLGLDDDTARDLYARVTGKRSLREMSPAEQDRVVGELRRQGFNKASSGSRKSLEGRFAKKLQALWIAGWNLGVVDNRDDAALLAFVKRQTGLDHVRFLRHPEDAAKAIEAIKAWLAREAKVDWSDGNYLPTWLRPSGAKVAVAQWQLLARAGGTPANMNAFRDFVREIAKPVDQMTERDWPAVMNALGRRVRELNGEPQETKGR